MKNFLVYPPVLWWLLSFDLAIAITAAHEFDGVKRVLICAVTTVVASGAAVVLVAKALDWISRRLGVRKKSAPQECGAGW